ncbi:hypothetical protein F0562_002601 [Nyssa sinensis]|uniref:non-specific serine/threonine protein kinase n=1 Tax=Nyssa sinensis TaxID=561372 RepID=A0A5J5C9Z9_9ASTE|nr:hypothetical protein F0562_002601 [Nyssa sinensis]
MNITTRAEFEAMVSRSSLDDVFAACNQSLENNSPCASCTTSLSSLQASYLTGPSIGNVTNCPAYPLIYAAAFVNQFGPTDSGTMKCLFSLDFTSANSNGKRRKIVISVVVIGCGIVLFVVFGGFWFLRRKRQNFRKQRRIVRSQTSLASGLDSISGSTTLLRFTFDEIKEATKNFSRHNIIGRGGYGNVYKGVLPDGSEVALKRFKNCSAAGDASFAHEVEVIASVRHVNLVALRGYCTATTPMEGHQRIIVCDLMKNGSIYDHLFGSRDKMLSWPIRQKIALGTARGLAYLHYGAQPAIIHRDIKGSNILLDEKFEPKVADFGLAKFTPEGMTHLSTRVAGTMGYVAPEYALYGQLTERSDVYSFGVVFLELLSGKKALNADNEGQTSLVTDWAWSLVREGRALDVIEDDMPDLGPPEVMEKYVLVAVLCSHPQLYARPTMDQVLKILESDLPVPSIPERPIPLIADIDDIERSVSNSVLCNMSTPGYRPYSFENDRPADLKEEEENSWWQIKCIWNLGDTINCTTPYQDHKGISSSSYFACGKLFLMKTNSSSSSSSSLIPCSSFGLFKTGWNTRCCEGGTPSFLGRTKAGLALARISKGSSALEFCATFRFVVAAAAAVVLLRWGKEHLILVRLRGP